jgi:hypothetical protein
MDEGQCRLSRVSGAGISPQLVLETTRNVVKQSIIQPNND